jgi:mannosyltransferase
MRPHTSGKQPDIKGLWEMFIEPPSEEPKSLPEDDPKLQPPCQRRFEYRAWGGALSEIDPESMEGEKYNMCHFWSNFEIARLDWFRSREYEEFFEMMDRSGGFWMERVSMGTSFPTRPES